MSYNICMIDFLTNESWISPQIDFLLLLQSFRLLHSDIYTKIFLSITAVGEVWFPVLICSIYYWCFDSKKGMYLYTLVGFHFMFGQLLKIMTGVYRPWILCDKIQPVEAAMLHSSGYSFPSGHSSMAASLFGGLAYIFRKKLFICFSFVFLILLIAFSRLWLCVHTPQDVIAGMLIGAVWVFFVKFLIDWAENNPQKRYMILLFIIDVFAFLALIYICYFNNLPLDYVNGVLLVNPTKAAHTSVVCYGISLGIINGAFFCRSFFPFDVKRYSIIQRIVIGIIGSIILFFMLRYPLEYCFSPECDLKPAFLLPFLMGFCLTAVYPFIFTKICKNEEV